MKQMRLAFLVGALIALGGCTKKQSTQVHVSSPFYRDIVSGLTVRVNESLPGVDVRWETVSSHEISTRLSKGSEPIPDVVITSDREFLDSQAKLGKWAEFTPANWQQLGCGATGKPFFYPIRYAVKGIGYHPDLIKPAKLPQRWVLIDKQESQLSYLSYPERLAQLEKREVPFAPVLVENILEARRRKVPLQIHYPKEGPVLIPTFIAVRKDSPQKANSIRVAETLLADAAQTVIQQSRLHPARLDMAGPEGTMSLKEILDLSGCGDVSAPALSE